MQPEYGILSMPGTGFFGMLVIGFLAGYVAERTMNRDHGILTNILVGIAGSFVGGTLAGAARHRLLRLPRQSGGRHRRRDPHPVAVRPFAAAQPELGATAWSPSSTRSPAAPRPRHPEKAHRPDQEVLRKPDWIRVRAPVSHGYQETRDIVKSHNLVTVCEEAGCPNIGECWDKKHATFMIMGEICTRACAFCNVATGMPGPLDRDEPENVGKAVAKMGLSHVVITSVDRDDLGDGGARHFADVIQAIRPPRRQRRSRS